MKVFKATAKVLGVHREGFYYAGMFHFNSTGTTGFKDLALTTPLNDEDEKVFFKKFRVCKQR